MITLCAVNLKYYPHYNSEGNRTVPGKKPGTSSRMMRGILKASQNLTNLAPAGQCNEVHVSLDNDTLCYQL